MKILIASLCMVLVATNAIHAEDGVSFSREVASILVDNCVSCHSAKKAEGGYRIDTFAYLSKSGDSGAAPVTAMKIEESELWRRVVTTDESERMPAESESLSTQQLDVLKRWIGAGAAFDGTNASEPLYLVAPPANHPEPPAKYPVSVPITSVAFSGDGSQVISGGYHELLCWNAQDGALLRRIKNIGERVYAIAVSGDGARIAVACGSPGKAGEVRLIDYASGAVVSVSARTSDVVLDVAFSPDGSRLVACGADGLIRVVDSATGATLQTIPSHADWVNAVAWSDDGKKLVSASRDKSVKVYTAENGELLASYAGHASSVKGVAFSPDGATVFSVGDDKKLHRWEIEGAKKVAEIALGGEGYKVLRGSDVLFVPATDKLLHRIDLAKNQETHKFAGHTDWVVSSALHAKSNQVVSGSIDGMLRLWNAADGTLVREWRGAP